MKRQILPLLALGATIITTGYLLGQSQGKSASAPAPTQKLMKVATLPTVQANQEFQTNVQVMQGQQRRAQELSAQVEKEKDPAKKKALQKELDAVMAKLNTDNELMVKTYGFSLARNYTMEIEKSNIYMVLTDEEAAKMEKAQKEQAAKKK